MALIPKLWLWKCGRCSGAPDALRDAAIKWLTTLLSGTASATLQPPSPLAHPPLDRRFCNSLHVLRCCHDPEGPNTCAAGIAPHTVSLRCGARGDLTITLTDAKRAEIATRSRVPVSFDLDRTIRIRPETAAEQLNLHIEGLSIGPVEGAKQMWEVQATTRRTNAVPFARFQLLLAD